MAELVDAAVFKTEVLSGANAGSSPAAGTTAITFKDNVMANARDQMKMIESELARIRSEMDRLRAQEELLLSLRQKMSGEPVPQKTVRKRSANIKPLVIDTMHEAGFAGATSSEVDSIVRRSAPTVAKDTVGSILSRLKADGALVYDGERYYEKQFAPNTNGPFETGLRAVN